MVVALARSPTALVLLLILSPLWFADFFEFGGLLWVVLFLVPRGVLLCYPLLLVVLRALLLLWLTVTLLLLPGLLRLRVVSCVSPSAAGSFSLGLCCLGLLPLVLLDLLDLLRDKSRLLLRLCLLLWGRGSRLFPLHRLLPLRGLLAWWCLVIGALRWGLGVLGHIRRPGLLRLDCAEPVRLVGGRPLDKRLLLLPGKDGNLRLAAGHGRGVGGACWLPLGLLPLHLPRLPLLAVPLCLLYVEGLSLLCSHGPPLPCLLAMAVYCWKKRVIFLIFVPWVRVGVVDWGVSRSPRPVGRCCCCCVAPRPLCLARVALSSRSWAAFIHWSPARLVTCLSMSRAGQNLRACLAPPL